MKQLLTSLCFIGISAAAIAQSEPSTKDVPPTYNKLYTTSGGDAGIFSTAFLQRPGISGTKLTTLRYSLILNGVTNLNYDVSPHFGLFIGLGLHNIGFIDKSNDTTTKRRIFSLNVPAGIKIGDMVNRRYVFFGGGFDVPLNYRIKSFTNRQHKFQKENYWFSDRTPNFMPNVFVGATVAPFTFKIQYYPGNFLNTDYTSTTDQGVSYKPFTNEKVNLLYLSIGFDIKHNKADHMMWHHHHNKDTKQMM